MALFVPARTAIQTIAPADGRTFTLAELQGLVGGYIEAIYLLAGAQVAFVNEDGKRLNLPFNVRATALLRPFLRTDDAIVGDIVICSRREAGCGEDADDDE